MVKQEQLGEADWSQYHPELSPTLPIIFSRYLWLYDCMLNLLETGFCKKDKAHFYGSLWSVVVVVSGDLDETVKC